MAKRQKLNKGQQRRVRANQKKRLQQDTIEWQSDQLGPLQQGRVVSRYGQHADVLTEDQKCVRTHIRRNIESLVCGDVVGWRPATVEQQGMQGVIEVVHERESLLSRPDYYDGLKPVAANIEQIFVVSSLLPAFSSQIIDRYIVACEDIGIEPILVVNKIDLMDELSAEQQQLIDDCLAVYQNIGYQVIKVSSQSGAGLAQLQQALKDHTSAFVGQSGVGKSSLINQILPEVEAPTQIVSENSGLGQHTTTVATWYPLPQGGAVIDSPGVREFALWHLAEERVAWCYVDFREYLGHCKFRDCKHRDDPGCALQQAVAAKELPAWRLDNYHRIIETMASQRPSRAVRGN